MSGFWFMLLLLRLRESCVISAWLFNVYMDGRLDDVSTRVLVKGLELLRVIGA